MWILRIICYHSYVIILWMVLLVLLHFWLLLYMCLVIGSPKTYTYLLLTIDTLSCKMLSERLAEFVLSWLTLDEGCFYYSLVRLTVLYIEQIRYIYLFVFPVPTLRYHPSSWSVTCFLNYLNCSFFQQQLCRYSCFILSGGISAAEICQLESWLCSV